MAKAKSGGGIKSSVNVKTGVKTGMPRADKINPGGVDALGQHFAGKITPLQSGTKPQVPLGNAGALNVGKGGAGTGRTVYERGTQSATPAARPMPTGRDTLSEFGPERRKE